jgi:3D (Asp-Asp-Asp) domain-containing protein
VTAATNATATPTTNATATSTASPTFGYYFGPPTSNATSPRTTNASSTFGFYFLFPNLLNCSSGWDIMGYFTPVEKDYFSPQKKIIDVQGLGNRSYNTEFLNDVLSEGWGKTKQGWYISNWDNTWHKSFSPLTSSGQPLTIGMVGTDPRVIHPHASISIGPLPQPWNLTTYIAGDFGGGLTGKSIDVYTGEGKMAQAKTIEVTGHGKTVCLLHETKSSIAAAAPKTNMTAAAAPKTNMTAAAAPKTNMTAAAALPPA